MKAFSYCCLSLFAAVSVLSILNAEVIPGAGGAIPAIAELEEPTGMITSLFVSVHDRANDYLGSGTHPQLDLDFEPPENYGATSFDLQRSVNGEGGWETVLTTPGASSDNFSFNPEGTFYFRLLVHGGPRDGQVSNVIYVEPSQVETRFSGWSIGTDWEGGGPMSPWVGHTLKASFSAARLDDGADVSDSVGFQWYRLNPETGDLEPIAGATTDTYTTTVDDVGGYFIVCRGSGNGTTVGGYVHALMYS